MIDNGIRICLCFHVIFFRVCHNGVQGQIQSLAQHNVDVDHISVSGLSAGGGMSNSLAFILSARFTAVGAFAGAPYLSTYFLNHDPNFNPFDVNDYVAAIKTLSAEGKIDNFTNSIPRKAFVHIGGNDPVPEFLGQITADLYKTIGYDTKYVLTPQATHCVPTLHNGIPCDSTLNILFQQSGVCACGYDVVFDMFCHFYGSSYIHGTSDAAYTGNLFKFDQNEFFANNDAAEFSMNDYGYVYVPTVCTRGGRCKIHLALHGCVQNEAERLTNRVYDMIENAGYLQAADLNHIIVVFPQVITINPTIHFVSDFPSITGCWDCYYGYTGCDFLYKNGKQVQFITNVINRLVDGI